MPLHLIKLAVGVDDLDHLSALMRARGDAAEGTATGRTRHTPRRAAELLEGGSLYWVIRGRILGRQAIRGVRPATAGEGAADGLKRCLITLDSTVVATVPVPHRAFQGWRYLQPDAAPADMAPVETDGPTHDGLPPHLAAELAALGL